MLNDKTKQAINRIQQLQESFSQLLPARIDELINSASNLKESYPPTSSNNFSLLSITHDLAHKLSGAAGSFQFTEISHATKSLEKICYLLLHDSELYPKDWLQQIQQLLTSIKSIPLTKTGSFRTKPLAPEANINPTSHEIILVDDDELLASLMQEQARHFGYTIKCIYSPNELADFLDNNSPEVILMDIVFPNSDFNGIDIINQLNAHNKIHCPVIFLSNSDNFKTRLNAVRAGSSGYIVKPVNILELVENLDRYTHTTIHDSFRTLIIGSNEQASKHFQSVLREHNITGKIITNPLTITETLFTFQPDVILLETHLHHYNSFDVAKVIRQDHQFTHIPILFLTDSDDINIEIQSLKSGGNGLILKNIDNDLFIQTILNHGQRSKKLHTVFTRLRNDEVHFQAVSHSSFDAIITLNHNGIITLWNEGAENIFNYQSIEVIGHSIEIIIPESLIEKYRKKFNHLFANNYQSTNLSFESKAITKDQKLISIELSYTEWLSGSERFFTCIIRDISDRKIIEEELANQQKNLKAIINHSAEGIISINDKGIIETVNPKALKIFQYHAKELEGQNISILMQKESASQHNAYIKHSSIHEVKTINQAREIKGLRKNGSTFPMELNFSPMTINGVKKYVGIFHDITDKKNSIKSITAAKSAAENANNAKSQFLSSMSHELRTPLNVILGFTQLIIEDTDTPVNEDQIESLEHVFKSGEHLLSLINEILDLSKIESGNVNVNLEPINLIRFIKQSLELVSPQAGLSQISITHELPNEEESDIIITVDPLRLSQILSNLLTNSIKYNHKHGNVKIWLTHNKKSVRFFVQNSGQGIPENKLKDLYTPFNRLGADKTEVEGSGIGLTITKMLIELMGGEIGVDNIYGTGCTFWVEFNKASPENFKNDYHTPEDSLQELNSNETVLYIEDNSANRLLIKKILDQYSNLQLVEAHTGNEGVETALKIKPQIILLDIHLPDIDGYEVLKQLQKNKSMDSTIIIAISANAMPDDIDKGNKTVLFSYLTKPIDSQELLNTINDALIYRKNLIALKTQQNPTN